MEKSWLSSPWLTPTEGSWLHRFLAGERSTWRPGSFLCGLRADAPGVAGLTPQWAYQRSSVEEGVLAFGRRRRLAVGLVQAEPIEAWVEPRTDFLVWAVRELDSGRPLELAVERRDAYLVQQLPRYPALPGQPAD